MVFYLETIYIQDQYPEEGYGWINLQNVFFFFICLPCSKRSPKEEAAMLPSSRQLCTFFVPAGFNGPIGNYADYNYADEVLCKYIYIYGNIFYLMLLLGDRNLLEYVLFFFLMEDMLENE